MKKLILHMIFILSASALWSRSENFRILTDRSIYVAGEDIRFSVFCTDPGEDCVHPVSQVLYLELVSPSGTSWSGTKVRLDSSLVGGLIAVPRDIPSGTYYLKAYTRWMRNLGPRSYTYLSIELVNPYVRTVLGSDTLLSPTLSLEKIGEGDLSPVPLMSRIQANSERRVPMALDLQLGSQHPPLVCCISVVPRGGLEKQWSSRPYEGDPISSDAYYVPETRGISISGTVMTDSSRMPVPFAVLYISMLGDKNGFFCNYSDSAGHFFVALPDITGETELFISASHRDQGNLQVEIDQDFCREIVKLPSFPFRVGKDREELVRRLVVHAQVAEQYVIPLNGELKDAPGDEKWFYGEPSSVIRFDDFIRLPTLEEYFTELTPQVTIRRSNRQKYFRVQGTHPDLQFYDPLLMVDGVAVYDMDAVLGISPAYIDRFEIVEAPFVRGNLTFGGIIHLISRKGDMGNMYLPSSGLLVNYVMYGANENVSPDFRTEDPRMPDVRNTLHWVPGLKLMPGEQRTIRFTGPDVPGEYEVVVRGFEDAGGYFEQRTIFRVE